jgi:hypothetical protein
MAEQSASATQEELRWMKDYLRVQVARLAQTSGRKAAEDFAAAMGGADFDTQQAWLETAAPQVTATASLVVEPGHQERPSQPGADPEALAERIYLRALEELRGDDMVPADSELDGIWQDACAQARSWTPDTEDELVTRVVDRYSMTLMDQVDGDELYRILSEFIADFDRLVSSRS